MAPSKSSKSKVSNSKKSEASKPDDAQSAQTAQTSTDPKLAQETQLAQAVGRIGNSRLSYLVGSAVLLLSVVGFVSAMKWDGHFYDRRGCAKIKVVQNHIFKVNSCDGTWEEIPLSKELK